MYQKFYLQLIPNLHLLLMHQSEILDTFFTSISKSRFHILGVDFLEDKTITWIITYCINRKMLCLATVNTYIINTTFYVGTIVRNQCVLFYKYNRNTI